MKISKLNREFGTEAKNEIENAKAVDIILSKNELEQVENLLNKYPNIGQRYSDGAMKLVNK